MPIIQRLCWSQFGGNFGLRVTLFDLPHPSNLCAYPLPLPQAVLFAFTCFLGATQPLTTSLLIDLVSHWLISSHECLGRFYLEQVTRCLQQLATCASALYLAYSMDQASESPSTSFTLRNAIDHLPRAWDRHEIHTKEKPSILHNTVLNSHRHRS